jgi:hypothetical protein
MWPRSNRASLPYRAAGAGVMERIFMELNWEEQVR